MHLVALTNNEQYICYSIYESLLILVNKVIPYHCQFMLAQIH